MQAAMPLERDTLRRFAQAIMDRDPLYYSDGHAAASIYRKLVAPPLYPVHAFRTAADSPDPLNSIQEDPDADEEELLASATADLTHKTAA